MSASTPRKLTPEEIEQFAEAGYLLLPGLLDGEQHLDPIRQVMAQAVERQAEEWLAAGLITDPCENLRFEKRYAALRRQYPPTHSNSWRRMLASRPVYDIWRYPPLLGVMRQLLGDELYASNIWNGRPRVPQQTVQTIDWHQDAQYMQQYDGIEDYAVSVWIPLVPVDQRSGCIQLIPGSHKRGLRPPIRVPRNNLIGLADAETAGQETVTCAMAPGDVLLFTELLYHRALDNLSDYIRWSIDVRYFDANNQALQAKERQRYRGSGYYCFSKDDPGRVGDYQAWLDSYQYEGEF